MNRDLSDRRTGVYRFDEFELDLGKGLLLFEDRPVPLQWKTFEVLCELISSGGDLIPREELIERVWPDSFVEENNLSQHIRALRKALGDGENGNRFIETVPRKGFRFLPVVEEVHWRPESALAVHEPAHVRHSASDLASTSRIRPPGSVNRRRFALVLLAVASAAAFFVWNNWEASSEERFRYANQIRLAAQALESSDLPLLNKLLEDARPGFFEADQRGFEWAYLARRSKELSSAPQAIMIQHSAVDSVAYSPDGKLLATAGMDMVIRLWDVATGQQIKTFEGHKGWLVWVAFSPDGKRLVSGAFERSAKVWDVESGQVISTINGESVGIGWFAFLPDGKTIAGADGDKIRFWDTETGAQKRMTSGHAEYMDAKPPLALSNDGRRIAARTNDQAVVVWELNGQRASSFRPDVGGLFDLKFSPDSSMLLAGGDSGRTELWNANTGERLQEFLGHSAKIRDVAFSADGRFIATGSEDNTVKLWDPEKGILLATLSGHADDVTALAISPDGSSVASGTGQDDIVRIRKVPANLRLGILSGHSKPVGKVSFSPDSKALVSASEDGTAKLWNVETETDILALKGQTRSVNFPVFSSSGNLIAAGDDDQKIRLWEAGTGREVMTIDTPKPATNLAFSPDEKLLATGHWFHDRSVRLWDVGTGGLVCSFEAHKAGPGQIEFSRDGETLLTSALDDSFVRLWETVSCREIWSYQGETGAALFAQFAPDGRPLALQVINDFRSLKLIDLRARKDIATFSGHQAELSGASLSPDGNRLFTSDSEGLIKIWDAVTGQELLTIKADMGKVESTALSPDGQVLAAAGSNGTIRLWRASVTD